ncbi:MAG: hypothetical protein K5686_02815 [Lachnospiraceae bacterium]|nr:hypothetical protein [Lachnospiraceae bacterium]
MNDIRILVIAVWCVIVAIWFINFIRKLQEEKGCTALAAGKLSYSDQKIPKMYRGTRDCWIPVYEYEVEGTVYMAEIAKAGTNANAFAAESDVHYNPLDPGICFIDGFKGKIISKYDKENEKGKKDELRV